MKRISSPAPPLWLVITAFAAVYVIWGSTYLGIRYAVESIPPLIMAGTRNLTAGLLLFAFVRIRNREKLSLAEWRDATIIGGLLLTIGNGGISWAEQTIPSGVTALIAALTPAWIVIFDWMRPRGARPSRLVVTGVAVGFFGVAILSRDRQIIPASTDGLGMAVLLAATLAWAFGSVFSRGARKPASALMAGSMQMMAGGMLLLLVAALDGEGKGFSIAHVTPLAIGAWFYLVCVGSLIGYTAYSWLLHVSTPARVATYAYVNPLIALLLGCTIAHEAFTHELGIAGIMIVASVALIIGGTGKGAASCQPSSPVLPE